MEAERPGGRGKEGMEIGEGGRSRRWGDGEGVGEEGEELVMSLPDRMSPAGFPPLKT
jgi:hypothetical protein